MSRKHANAVHLADVALLTKAARLLSLLVIPANAGIQPLPLLIISTDTGTPPLPLLVIPAQAGIHSAFAFTINRKNNSKMDPSLRWDDGKRRAAAP